MHIKIDTELCQGTGYCTRISPDVFELRDGMAFVLRQCDGDEELTDQVVEAESLCPSGAILL